MQGESLYTVFLDTSLRASLRARSTRPRVLLRMASVRTEGVQREHASLRASRNVRAYGPTTTQRYTPRRA